MTMPRLDPNCIWRRVREDQDVDDLIFRDEYSQNNSQDTVTCSDR